MAAKGDLHRLGSVFPASLIQMRKRNKTKHTLYVPILCVLSISWDLNVSYSHYESNQFDLFFSQTKQFMRNMD